MSAIRLSAAERSLKGQPSSVRDIYDWLLALRIASKRQGRGDWTMPRQSVIAERTGYHIRTVRRALAELRRLGLLLVQPRYYSVGGMVKRAANRLFLFVAGNAFAINRSRRLRRKPLATTVEGGIAESRAPTKAHKQQKAVPPSGDTAFLRLWKAR